MKNKFIITFMLIFVSTYLTAQNCEAYIPTKTGVVQTYVSKDKKDKITGYSSQEIISAENDGGKIVYKIAQSSFDAKKALLSQDTLDFFCENNNFHVDMETYLSKEQLAAYEESEIKITFENIDYPVDLKPGTSLKDGFIQAEINVGMPLIFRTDIVNRKAVANEEVTTEAGTFNTLKITQDVQGKYGFVKVNMSTTSWVIKDIGTVRSETYDKSGKLISSSELISIK